MEENASMPTRTNVPGEWPFLGHLPAFYKDKLGFLDRCAETRQPVVRLRVGGTTLLLREPADIRYVLQEDAAVFTKSPLISGDRGFRLFGQGVLTSSGDRHRRLRSALQPVFSQISAAKFSPAIIEVMQQMTNAWQSASVRDLRIVMPELAEAVSSRILFGADYLRRRAELNRAFRIRRKYLQFRFDFPFAWSAWAPVPLQFRYRNAMKTIREYVAGRIAEARRHQGGASCLLDSMAATSLTDEELLDEGIALGITGYEPVGEGLVWALWLIARHPETQARLRQEALQYFQQGAPDDAPLPYTWAVLQESMRLYPPTWLFLRYATAPVTLPSGESVPAGAKIYLSPWLIHRDPRFYPEPLSFQPERFLPGSNHQRPRLSFMPFGAGSRMCLGMHFTAVESTRILASLIRDFDVSPVTAGPIHPKARMTLQAATLVQVRFERRS
jgi:cytochrome P450